MCTVHMHDMYVCNIQTCVELNGSLPSHLSHIVEMYLP